jgi:hypothetical protein
MKGAGERPSFTKRRILTIISVVILLLQTDGERDDVSVMTLESASLHCKAL